MKTLFLAGPFRGPSVWAVYLNVHAVEKAGHQIAEAALKQNTPVALMCPHPMTFHMEGTFTDEYWLEATMEWLLRSDAVYMIPGWERSSGATAERARAMAKGKPVFEDVADVLSWLKATSNES